MAAPKYDLKTILTIIIPLLLGAGGMQTVNYAGKADCGSPIVFDIHDLVIAGAKIA